MYRKKCLACSPKPPTLSTQVIRALGTGFCQIEAEELSDGILHNRGKLPSSVGSSKKELLGRLKKDKAKKKDDMEDPGKQVGADD